MSKKKPRIIFICKRRPAQYGASYGLLNSCRFLCNALINMGAEAKTVEVIDNNFIDREVHLYKPTHVFIEALWVVPEKFEVLIPLHSKVQWHVRLHSNTPFISNEGIAIPWIKKYIELSKKYPQFHVSPNSFRLVNDLWQSLHYKSIYSPNIYQPHVTPWEDKEIEVPCQKKKETNVINIGCFGAIRPMKNLLIQAMAAIAFSEELGKTLHFHVNQSRQEMSGENTYKNLVSLFENSKHKLVNHAWLLHSDFIQVIKQMDLGMQVTFSETFNIVSADFATSMVPIVGTSEIEWMNWLYKAKPTDLDNIVSHLWLAWLGRNWGLHYFNLTGLKKWNKNARQVWKNYLKLM